MIIIDYTFGYSCGVSNSRRVSPISANPHSVFFENYKRKHPFRERRGRGRIGGACEDCTWDMCRAGDGGSVSSTFACIADMFSVSLSNGHRHLAGTVFAVCLLI